MSDLRKLAKAATPGPWHDDYWDGLYHVESPEILVVIDVEPVSDKKQAGRNAAYIAAANPLAILALLDRRDEAAQLTVVFSGKVVALCKERDALAVERETANVERVRYLSEIKALAAEVERLKKVLASHCEIVHGEGPCEA